MDPGGIALVLLASGLSTRFGGDKLLAPFRGKPLLAHAAAALGSTPVATRIAVVGTDQTARADLVARAGWDIALNPAPEEGQGASLATGMRAASETGATAALILLGDMPLVPDAHLEALMKALTPDLGAVFSRVSDRRQPPVIFARWIWPQLIALSGDQGARNLSLSASASVAIALDPACARDIDTPNDLQDLERASLA